jgi:hypothetical protein
MKKGLMLVAVFIVVTGAQAQNGNLGNDVQFKPIPTIQPVGPERKPRFGHGPVVKGPFWKISTIKPLATQSTQLLKLSNDAIEKIKQANNLEELKKSVDDFSSKLIGLKPAANGQAQQFLNGLAINLKNLIDEKPEDVIIAAKTLHRNLTQLPVLLQNQNLLNLYNALLGLKKAYLTVANKKAALSIKEAATKSGQKRDELIISGLAALPLHAHDVQTTDLTKESIDLAVELKNALQKSKDGQEIFKQIQIKALDIQPEQS